MPVYLIGPPTNPFARLLAGLVGVLALVGAVFFGLFLFAAVIAVGLVVWVVVWLRLWWVRRRLAASGVEAHDPFARPASEDSPRDSTVIDADYEVVSRDQEKD